MVEAFESCYFCLQLAKDVPKKEPLATTKGQEPRYAPLGTIIGGSAVVWASARALGCSTLNVILDGAGQFSATMTMPVIAILGDRFRQDRNLHSEMWLEESRNWRSLFFLLSFLGLGFLLVLVVFGVWDRLQRHQRARSRLDAGCGNSEHRQHPSLSPPSHQDIVLSPTTEDNNNNMK